MLSAANSYLVAGSLETHAMKTQWVKVLRSFLIEGKPQPVGKEIEVSALFAAELRSAKKAEFCDPPKPAAKAEPVKAPEKKAPEPQQQGAK